VEQKNFTHVRQLLGYGRYDDIRLTEKVNDLYENAWLPLRNFFTPVMKLIEKKRVGSKVFKTYDTPKTPCDRLLECPHVAEKTKETLREQRAKFDPFTLAALIEEKLQAIQKIITRIEERRAEEKHRAGEAQGEFPMTKPAGAGCVTAPVAIAPGASTSPAPAASLAKSANNPHQLKQVRVS
jgi:hypothetical protein